MPLQTEDDFVPSPWLRNPHAQTVYAAHFAPRPAIAFRRNRWLTPDADFIDLDWIIPAQAERSSAAAGAPLIVLFHGLEGSSRSHYARTLMKACDAQGWCGVVVHFRGCSGEPNRLPRAYHSGDSQEIGWILARIRREHPGRIAAVGVSLGANALLKWLGENAEAAQALVAAACAVSAPMDLVAAGSALDRGFNRVYGWNFLRTLRAKSLAKLADHPGLYDARAVRRAWTLRDFDDCVTAPLHGFFDAHDYWVRASSKPWLEHIAVPTLVLNARDDPFLPEHALATADQASAAVTLHYPRHGGHVGFVSGAFPGSLDWLPRRVVSFLAQNFGRQPRMA